MPTRMMPVKAPIIVISSMCVIISLSQMQAKRAMKKGVAFMITKKVESGRCSMATTKHKNVMLPLMHLVNRMCLFELSMFSVRLSLYANKKIVEAVKLNKLRKKASSNAEMWSCLASSALVNVWTAKYTHWSKLASKNAETIVKFFFSGYAVTNASSYAASYSKSFSTFSCSFSSVWKTLPCVPSLTKSLSVSPVRACPCSPDV